MSFWFIISRYVLFFCGLEPFKIDIVQYSKGTELAWKQIGI